MSASAISTQMQAGSAAARSNRVAQDGAPVNAPQAVDSKTDASRRAQEQIAVQQIAASRQAIDEEVDVLNELANILNHKLSFAVREESGETYVRVVDRETGEVVRVIPPEELMELSERIRSLAGLFFEGEA